MAKHMVEDDNGGTEDTRSKPAPVRSGCQENNKSLRKSVGNKTLAKSVGVGEELLPGILDDITLELIIPKLSWRDLHVLRSVSPTWQEVIQSHVVYESRVRSQSTDTLAIVAHCKASGDVFLQLSVYSLREDVWSRLPRNPYFPEGIARYSQCVSLDGKLYIMGGVKEYRREFGHKIKVGSARVYVLDIAGQRQWQECAEMREPRLDFCCGVIDHKIYVFGGTSCDKPLYESEVYDPKVNTWSRIKPMMYCRVKHDVFKLGRELFVYGRYDSTAIGGSPFWTKDALCLEAYDPVKDEWRLITSSFKQKITGMKVFTVQGKIYSMTREHARESCRIELYDIYTQAWTPVQPCCPAEDFKWYTSPLYSTVVDHEPDHELLGITIVKVKGSTGLGWAYWISRSRGFGNGKEDCVWELCGPLCPYIRDPRSMCTIQI